ncbi:MAG: hypothetical protein ISN29_02405 [Gammaproteobacteria bacterium AqS3]|nr:hypothetical protein [Gammaproteobacteria bacterium AqS3]
MSDNKPNSHSIEFTLDMEESFDHIVLAKTILAQLVDLNPDMAKDFEIKVMKRTIKLLEKAADEMEKIVPGPEGE